MFTGIIEAVGKVVGIDTRGEHVRLSVEEARLAPEVALGDSVAVCGACLTIAEPDPRVLHFDAIRETLDKTALGDLRPGSVVNLERALRADQRLDGHIVQGHVDEAGRVREWVRSGSDVQLGVDASRAFTDQLVPKGSVTLHGVALTICGLEPGRFDVALIPHTLEVTTLASLAPGDRVNLESDVLGKYVLKYLERILPAVGGAAA